MQDQPELQRITTQYVATEDRLRLSGETADGLTVVLWLTQRLMNLLAPQLTGWLERQDATGGEALQEFAQQAAEASLAAQPPVQATSPETEWRLITVDIVQGPEGVTLILKSDDDIARARLPMPTHALRQWLGIVRNQYVLGAWPTTAWPAWMDETQAASTAPAPAVLH
jgi:hypothetical protein